jgi:hypothetical protein
MRHNSHTPATMAATMLSNRTVLYRVEPDIKLDMGALACRFRLELELVDIELAGERNAVWRGAAPRRRRCARNSSHSSHSNSSSPLAAQRDLGTRPSSDGRPIVATAVSKSSTPATCSTMLSPRSSYASMRKAKMRPCRHGAARLPSTKAPARSA